MSNSNLLSETIYKNKITSVQAAKIEKNVVLANNIALHKLKQKYPQYNFINEKTLPKIDMNNRLKLSFNNYEVGSNLSILKSHIKPDGGLTYVITKNDKKFLLGITEAKKQGTNDLRVEKGKKKQAQGNAIERSYKNYKELENYFLFENIFPFMIFVNGCDLENSNCSIRDRLTGMILSSPFNKIYVHKIADIYGYLHSRASIFIGLLDIEEMAEKIFTMFDISMDYYKFKYQGDFNDTSE